MRALSLVTAPAEEPVDLTDVKNHLRVDVTDDDDRVTTLLIAARRKVEQITRHALITQTWDLKLDGFPAHECIELPLPPLQSVASVKYKDSAGTETTWAASNYLVDTASTRGRIVPAYSVSWPSFIPYPVHPVTVRFTAGFGDVDDIPEDLTQALLLLVGHWYENREAVTGTGGVTVAPQVVPFAVETLLAEYAARTKRF